MDTKKLLPDHNSLSTIIDRIGWGPYQVKVLLIIGLGSISLGASFSVMTVLPFILQHTWGLSHFEISFLGTCFLIGGMLSYLFTIFYGEKIGRLNLFCFSYSLLVITAIAATITPDIYSESVMRLINGFAIIGAITASTPYILENTPTRIRGACSVLFWLFFSIGEVMIFVIALYLMPSLDKDYWKELSIISVVPAFFAVIGAWIYLKQSPLLLINSNRRQEAIEVLNFIAAQNSRPECTDSEKTLVELMKSTIGDTVTSRLNTLFNRSLLKKHVMIISIWTVALNNFYGLYFVFPYLIDIEYNRNTVGWIVLLCAATQIPISVVLMVFVEQKGVGRVSSLVACFGIVVAFSIFAVIKPFQWAFYVSVGMIYGFLDGILFVLYPYTAEVYNTEVRTSSLSLVNTVSRILTLASPSLFLTLLNVFPDSVFFMLIGSNVLAAILVLSLKIETRDKLLDELSE